MIPCSWFDARQGDDALFGFLAREIQCVSHSGQLVLILGSRLLTLGFRSSRHILTEVLRYGFASLKHTLHEVFVELLFSDTGLIFAVLLVVHSEFEQLFVVLTAVPAKFFHLLDILRQHIRIEFLRVVGIELESFLFGQFDNLRCQFAGQFAGLAEYHAPHSGVHAREVFLAHRAAEEVHQRSVLHILAERRHETRRTEHRPYTLYLIEELNEQFVFR